MNDSQIEEVLTIIEAKPEHYRYNRLSNTVAFLVCNTNGMLKLSAVPCKDRFYLIFDEASNPSIVGCVIDGVSDLHWYIRPKYRRYGHLTKALQSVILKHILEQPRRKVVRISISTDINDPYSKQSLKVARSVGFRKIPVKQTETSDIPHRYWYTFNPKHMPSNHQSHDEKR